MRLLKIIAGLASTSIACCFTLALTAGTSAADDSAPAPLIAMEKEPSEARANQPFEFGLSAGYRKDHLDWNEASANGSINIMSELKWENLNAAQIGATAKLHFHSDWSLAAALDFARIHSGSNQDSDYGGNNRTLELSRSNNQGGGELRDASVSLGRTLRPWDDSGTYSVSLTPLLGWSTHQQNLTMTDGVKTLGAPLGPFSGLNSSYDARWRGFWLGMGASLETDAHWSLNATAEYHRADYTAQGYWNLRRFSFTHTAIGQGFSLAAGATYRIDRDWKAIINLDAQQWRTGTGTDRTYYSDGTVGTFLLNRVNWGSTAINLGVVRQF